MQQNATHQGIPYKKTIAQIRFFVLFDLYEKLAERNFQQLEVTFQCVDHKMYEWRYMYCWLSSSSHDS